MEIGEYRTYNEKEILPLYASVGWTAYTDHPEVLRKGFENSMLTLAAYEGGNLLGIIRIVGDGHTVVFVQDILVFPEYQRKGIGSALMDTILHEAKESGARMDLKLSVLISTPIQTTIRSGMK